MVEGRVYGNAGTIMRVCLTTSGSVVINLKWGGGCVECPRAENKEISNNQKRWIFSARMRGFNHEKVRLIN